jgi:hypothetical protein
MTPHYTQNISNSFPQNGNPGGILNQKIKTSMEINNVANDIPMVLHQHYVMYFPCLYKKGMAPQLAKVHSMAVGLDRFERPRRIRGRILIRLPALNLGFAAQEQSLMQFQFVPSTRFREAKLRESELREDKSREADFREAEFQEDNFREAEFREDNFREA